MKPQVLARELGQAAVATTPSWRATAAPSPRGGRAHIPAKRGQMHSFSGNLATMACGLPYAIAAQIAYPDRQCVAFVGDGGFSMLMAEFATCVKYQLPIKVVVVKNNTLGQIKWEQMVFLGNPGIRLRPAADRLRHVRARRAAGPGSPSRIPPTAAAAWSRRSTRRGRSWSKRMSIPTSRRMPAKITLEQAAKFAESLVRGEPNREQDRAHGARRSGARDHLALGQGPRRHPDSWSPGNFRPHR